MYNDRPISEIAEIIFNMDEDRVKRAQLITEQGILEGSKAQTRKRVEEMKYQRLLNQIEDDEYQFDTPFMDKEYFQNIRG